MYRRAVIMEQESVAHDQFLTRFGSLPVVHSAWGQACDIYQRTKDRNALLRFTCNLAEGGVQTVVSTTKPLVQRYQPQIDQVNTYACEKLALVEENYPIITRPVDEVMAEGKEKGISMVKPVTDSVSAKVNYVCDTYNGLKTRGQQTVDAAKSRVVAVKDFGVSQVNKGLSTSVGQYALEKVHEALTTTDEYIEKYMPMEEDETLPGEKDVAGEVKEIDEKTLEGAANHIHVVSTKLRRRMYKRAMHDLKGLQMRSKERISNFNFTVDLIQYAKCGMTDVKDTLDEKYDLARSKVVDVWDQINDDPNKAPEAETLETMTIALARRLVFKVKQDVGMTMEFIRTNAYSWAVLKRLQDAKRRTEEIYKDLCARPTMGMRSENGMDDSGYTMREFILNNVTGPLTLLVQRIGLLPSSRQVTDQEDMEMEPFDTGRSGTEDDSDRSE